MTDTGKATVAAILIGVGFLAFGGTALLNGGGINQRRSSKAQPDIEKLRPELEIKPPVVQGARLPKLAFGPPKKKTEQRKRAAQPKALQYNRDGTISLRCRFTPTQCKKKDGRRRGKKLFSIYYKG